MSSRIYRNIVLLLLAGLIAYPAFFCNPSGDARGSGQVASDWLNVYDTGVHYVGMTQCRGCHEDVYQTFIRTGMGQSFHYATMQKSAADFSRHAHVYDPDLDLHYRPYWEGDSLYFEEYRLEGKDTVHRLVQRIDYIIGSGQHTNSHIFSENGYLYQAPITFYTQKQRWDLAPGFEHGASSRFSRVIESECMTCHNAYPEMVPGGSNKYVSVPVGIDCERCHGPGSLHVAEKLAGKITDTSKGPDYTIVNPRRLSVELQNDICQRCHLQGIAVLNDGKTFFDFRPGMRLSEVMNVFMPEYEGGEDKMIMASHVERMKKSDCYLSSGEMSCITCHKPHVSVKFTPRAQYTDACKGCHGSTPAQIVCRESVLVRAEKNDDCVSCHMPQNSSIDIPHVAVTDHYIRRRPLGDSAKSRISAFLGMRSYNNDNPEAVTRARAFMEFYERYNPNRGLLDSALFYLRQDDAGQQSRQKKDLIRAYFLLQDYGQVLRYAEAVRPGELKDAWTAYRIGEASVQSGQAEQALPWYAQAVSVRPYALDFQSKYGACLLMLGRLAEAEKVYRFILSENPRYPLAHSNLGFVLLQQGDEKAYYHLRQALLLDPDHQQTRINLAVWHYGRGQHEETRRLLRQLLRRFPENEQARMMLEDLDA